MRGSDIQKELRPELMLLYFNISKLKQRRYSIRVDLCGGVPDVSYWKTPQEQAQNIHLGYKVSGIFNSLLR